MSARNTIVFWRVVSLAWVVIILLLTSWPSPEVPATNLPGADKLLHFLLYVPLGFAVGRTLKLSNRTTSHFIFAGLALVAFAALDELHQLLIPGRFCSGLDMAADIIGASMGLLAASLMKMPQGRA